MEAASDNGNINNRFAEHFQLNDNGEMIAVEEEELPPYKRNPNLYHPFDMFKEVW